MNVIKTQLPGVLIIEPRVHHDERGHFVETFHAERYKEIGIDLPFVQDNFSRSKRGTLRGLHFQIENSQGKLVRCTRGEVWDVAADINPASPTFGQWVGHILSDSSHAQMWIPPHYAHGFLVLSEAADFQYKCTDVYNPSAERGIRWDDEQLNINWPLETIQPTLSPKDAVLPSLHDYLSTKGILPAHKPMKHDEPALS